MTLKPNIGDALLALEYNNHACTAYPENETQFLESYQGPDLTHTWVQIKAKLVELQAEYDALEYARIRKAEYDALNQFEMQFDDELNDTTTWKDAINAIKAKYPKPE